MAAAVTASVVAAAVPIAVPAVVVAEPAAPQPDTQCTRDLAGALTQLSDNATYLECRDQPGIGYRWQIFDSPYPNSDRWLTYGPKLTLHGEGQRNLEISSGDWIAYPQDSGSQCTAEQLAVVSAGELSPPQVSTGVPGRPLNFRVVPLLFTIQMSGYCLWQQVQ